MARPLRIERPGGWYHITGGGVERRAIFRDERDRKRLVELLAEAVSSFGWVAHGYTLMDKGLERRLAEDKTLRQMVNRARTLLNVET